MNHFFITYCFLKEQNKVTLTFLKASVLFSKKPEQIQISISVQDGFFLWPLDFFSLPNVNEIKVRSGQWWVVFFLLALTRNFTQAIKVQNCIWYADKKQDWEWSLCLFNGHLMLPPLAVAERGITEGFIVWSKQLHHRNHFTGCLRFWNTYQRLNTQGWEPV